MALTSPSSSSARDYEVHGIKRRPTHPGEVLREDVLPALGITQGELAKRLGVSRLTVSELLREKRAVSPDMALRLARLLDTTAESWLGMQQAVDLWELGRARTRRYARIRSVHDAARWRACSLEASQPLRASSAPSSPSRPRSMSRGHSIPTSAPY